MEIASEQVKVASSEEEYLRGDEQESQDDGVMVAILDGDEETPPFEQ